MLFIYLYHDDLYSDLWKSVTCILDPPRNLLELHVTTTVYVLHCTDQI